MITWSGAFSELGTSFFSTELISHRLPAGCLVTQRCTKKQSATFRASLSVSERVKSKCELVARWGKDVEFAARSEGGKRWSVNASKAEVAPQKSVRVSLSDNVKLSQDSRPPPAGCVWSARPVISQWIERMWSGSGRADLLSLSHTLCLTLFLSFISRVSCRGLSNQLWLPNQISGGCWSIFSVHRKKCKTTHFTDLTINASSMNSPIMTERAFLLTHSSSAAPRIKALPSSPVQLLFPLQCQFSDFIKLLHGFLGSQPFVSAMQKAFPLTVGFSTWAVSWQRHIPKLTIYHVSVDSGPQRRGRQNNS